MLDYTGADAVMIGRGAYGRPWIFKEVNDFLENGYYAILPTEEKCRFMLRHIQDLHQFYGEEKGYRIARKHVGWYIENLAPNSTFKRAFNALESTKAQLNALEGFVEDLLD